MTQFHNKELVKLNRMLNLHFPFKKSRQKWCAPSHSPRSCTIRMLLSYDSSLGYSHRKTLTIQFADRQKFISSYLVHLNQDVSSNYPRVDEHNCLRSFTALHTRRQISRLLTTLRRSLYERHRSQALLLR
jgi:hypothetical protein